MKIPDQHIDTPYSQIMSLLYLVFVLAIFGQYSPYQSLVQEPIQEGFQKASNVAVKAVALPASVAEFNQTASKFPFGSSAHFSTSSSSFTTVPFRQAIYRQAFKTAGANFLAFKPRLIKRWQVEQLSLQKHASFIV